MEENKQSQEVKAASATNATPTEAQSVTSNVNRKSSTGSSSGPSSARGGGLSNQGIVGNRAGKIFKDLSISGLALLGIFSWIGWNMLKMGNDTFEFWLREFLFLLGTLLLSAIVIFTARTLNNNHLDDKIPFDHIMDVVATFLLTVFYIAIHLYYSFLVYYGGCHGENTSANMMTAVIVLTVLAANWIIIFFILLVGAIALCVECFEEIKRRKQTNYVRMPVSAETV